MLYTITQGRYLKRHNRKGGEIIFHILTYNFHLFLVNFWLILTFIKPKRGSRISLTPSLSYYIYLFLSHSISHLLSLSHYIYLFRLGQTTPMDLCPSPPVKLPVQLLYTVLCFFVFIEIKSYLQKMNINKYRRIFTVSIIFVINKTRLFIQYYKMYLCTVISHANYLGFSFIYLFFVQFVWV